MREAPGGSNSPREVVPPEAGEAEIPHINPDKLTARRITPDEQAASRRAAVEKILLGTEVRLGKLRGEVEARKVPSFTRSEREAAHRFGWLLTGLVEERMAGIPVPDRYTGRHLFMSRRSYEAYLNGERLPGPTLLTQMIRAIETASGRELSPSEAADLRLALSEAREVRSPKARLDAARIEMAEWAEADRALAAEIATLQKDIAAVTDLVVGLSADPDQQREALVRLQRARTALTDALRHRDLNSDRLRECAEELLDALDNYLPSLP